jgi:hypothetical protein
MALFKNGLIIDLEPDEIFVFGSNLAGRHGAGAAKQAVRWGALYGIGRGLRGQTYALPTKDIWLHTMPHDLIAAEIKAFALFAAKRSALRFYLTAIGTGLAGIPEALVRQWVESSGITRNVIPWWEWMEEVDV